MNNYSPFLKGKSFKFPLVIAVMTVLFSLSAYSSDAEFKIIANTSVAASSISAEDVREVFLETRDTLADGSHVEPVLSKGGAAHEAFLRRCLNKTDSSLQLYYRSLVFTGKAFMPKFISSDSEVVAYVARTRGAIGYVSKEANVSGVKVLQVR